MAQGKSFFIDTTRCTACRGCQIACKNWNRNGVSPTRNTGSHQNPPDLDGNTFKLVRFSEVLNDGKLAWYFFADQCRHCLDPPCKDAIEGYVDGAVLHDPATGAVVYTSKTREVPLEEVRDACPYNIPRATAEGRLVKCTMCIDRVSNGLLPACVKVCPSGAMNFGERKAMLELAEQRLQQVRGKHPGAQLINAEEVRVIYLVEADPKLYYKFAMASAARGIDRKVALRRMLKPAAGLWHGRWNG